MSCFLKFIQVHTLQELTSLYLIHDQACCFLCASCQVYNLLYLTCWCCLVCSVYKRYSPLFQTCIFKAAQCALRLALSLQAHGWWRLSLARAYTALDRMQSSCQLWSSTWLRRTSPSGSCQAWLSSSSAPLLTTYTSFAQAAASYGLQLWLSWHWRSVISWAQQLYECAKGSLKLRLHSCYLASVHTIQNVYTLQLQSNVIQVLFGVYFIALCWSPVVCWGMFIRYHD